MLRCLPCGQEGRRQESKFCDLCGTKLVPSSRQDVKDVPSSRQAVKELRGLDTNAYYRIEAGKLGTDGLYHFGLRGDDERVCVVASNLSSWSFEPLEDGSMQLRYDNLGGERTGWLLSVTDRDPQQAERAGLWPVVAQHATTRWRFVEPPKQEDKNFWLLKLEGSKPYYVTLDELKRPVDNAYPYIYFLLWKLTPNLSEATVFNVPLLRGMQRHSAVETYNTHLAHWGQLMWHGRSPFPDPITQLISAYAYDVFLERDRYGSTFTYLRLPEHKAPPTELISSSRLDQYSNYSSFFAGGAALGTHTITVWDAVQIDLAQNLIVTNNFSFSRTTGAVAHTILTHPDSNCWVGHASFGTASDCAGVGSASGVARIDLRSTCFTAIDVKFQIGGWRPAGRTSVEAGGQLITLTGGGYCGGNAPVGDFRISYLPAFSRALKLAQEATAKP
eukprot:gb/GEZN01006710.1/.p1 GENE.gb/GEZN01006710.1/~~gb/GEZN01006710.1/.p1  ORF type:complete len:445 (+),score=32.11 gb/GEZN01006710.1/:78-1412(+)